jgi:hypothetical protein
MSVRRHAYYFAFERLRTRGLKQTKMYEDATS